MPKVSVIIPTYNRANLLPFAIQSVIRQTFKDWELIIVDDASTDDTKQVVDSFDDRRIRYIRHEENKGASAARNTGIKASYGEFIAFLDSDDIWLPKKLENQIRLFDKGSSKLGLVYTGFVIVDRDTGKILRRRIPSKRGNIYKEMLTRNELLTVSTWCVRKQCFNKVGLFDEDLPFGQGEDIDLAIRISRCYHVDFLKEPLVIYCVHKNRISTNLKSRIEAHNIILKKNSPDLDLLPKYTKDKILSHHQFYMGTLYCHNGDMHNGRRQFIKAIRLYPFDLKYYFYLLCTFTGSILWRQFTNVKRKSLAYVTQKRIGKEFDHKVPILKAY